MIFSTISKVRRWMRRLATVETPFGPLAGAFPPVAPSGKKSWMIFSTYSQETSISMSLE
jgi:hypothetical protein